MLNSKKLGIIIIIICILASMVFYSLTNTFYQNGQDRGCYLQQDECKKVQSSITITNFAFGIVGFLLALGVYMLIFHRSEEDVLKKIEAKEKNSLEEKIKTEKFNIILGLLDEDEKNVLKALKDQEGITQQTLRIRTGLTKTKLSQILINFERKNIVKREKSGKTLAIFLKKNI